MTTIAMCSRCGGDAGDIDHVALFGECPEEPIKYEIHPTYLVVGPDQAKWVAEQILGDASE